MARKFYKTIIQIEVLSEDEPFPDGMSLNDIHYAITDGEHSGVVKTVKSTLLTGKQAAKALQAQGSASEFFGLTPDGRDLNRH